MARAACDSPCYAWQGKMDRSGGFNKLIGGSPWPCMQLRARAAYACRHDNSPLSQAGMGRYTPDLIPKTGSRLDNTYILLHTAIHI